MILNESNYHTVLDKILKKSGEFHNFSSFLITYKISKFI